MLDPHAIEQLLSALNVLIVPALVFVVRIDRRMGQLDVLQSAQGADVARLERICDNLNQRLTRMEFRP